MARIGQLRHKVTVQSVTETENSFGETVKTLVDVADVYARVQPLQGRELFAAQQVMAEITTRITMRYSTDVAAVSPKHQVKFGTTQYDILNVINTETRDRILQLMCKEHI